jgi:hypothetical protein
VLQGNAAGKDHDLADVGNMDSVELASWLRVSTELLGGAIESPGSVRLVERDIDGAKASSVHANMLDQVSTFVDNGDAHGLFNLFSLLDSGCNDAVCVCKTYHNESFLSFLLPLTTGNLSNFHCGCETAPAGQRAPGILLRMHNAAMTLSLVLDAKGAIQITRGG